MVKANSSNSRKILRKAGDILGVSPEEVPRTVRKLLEETHSLEKKIKNLKRNL